MKKIVFFLTFLFFLITNSLWGKPFGEMKRAGQEERFFPLSWEKECLVRRIRNCVQKKVQKVFRSQRVRQVFRKWRALEKCPFFSPLFKDEVGLLVLAHGGDKEWNQGVLKAVQPLKKYLPTEVAFGMARADTIQRAVQKLEAQGVRKIVVVRLFLSPFSFRKRTEMILGLRPGAPPKPKVHRENKARHHSPFWRISARSSFRMNKAGLMNSPLVDRILADRAKELSRDPKRETVLLLAHGVGSKKQNAYWLSQMEQRTRLLKKMGFAQVKVEVLSEDWPKLRRKAEKRIRSIVQQELAKGRRVLVIPFRLYGFGPYKQVLQGLKYVANGRGFLPHPLVTRWIRLEAEKVIQEAKWPNPFSKTGK